MKIHVDAARRLGEYSDPTKWQNSTLRYSPPESFPAHLAEVMGRAEIMRVWITLDEYWDYRTGEFYPDYDIGVARYDPDTLHYPYDWKKIVPAPSGTRFHAYLTSHAAAAQQLLLNVRRLEREVSDGVITYDQYETVFERAVEYCKSIAPNIRYVEVCNEVDIKSFGDLTAEEYVKIYLRAHRAVRRLNQKHNYDLPLEVGGYAAAHPLHQHKLVSEIMSLLSKSEIGDCPMDFYSYHHYEVPSTVGLVRSGMTEEAELSDVQKLELIYSLHDRLIKRLGLPQRPVFLNELGRARATGVDGDALYNAAGNITYLLAFGCHEQPLLYPFPWCTFHNPKLQISYTQFLLREDGNYAMTPNGIAIKMLHDLRGQRLECEVTESHARDARYQAVAVADGEDVWMLAVNPTGDTVCCRLVLDGLESGQYRVTARLCDASHNNCVTCSACRGDRVEITGEAVRTADANGTLRHHFYLENSAFVLYKIEKLR